MSQPDGSDPAHEAPRSERGAPLPTYATWLRQRAGRALIDGVTAGPDVRAALRATFHAVVVGATVGVVSIVFYLLLRAVEHFVLGTLVGHRVLLPAGEPEVTLSGPPLLSPWFMVLLPALGGLASGVLVHRYAPETGGGGGNAYVASFHSTGAGIRRRVAWLKIVATAFTLGTGGSAGREGPTMQVGAAIGDRISRKLRLSRKDQRRLLVAGTAAGLTAMFGTPLGAALLATEVLYRDDFESEALVPAILASVTAFALVGTVLPEQRELFAHAARYDVSLTNLALCLPLVALLFGGARLFVALLRTARRFFGRVRTPWLRPAIGGLALGFVGTLALVFLSPHLGVPGIDVGLFGHGYGTAQVAISGASWLGDSWRAALVLGGLGVAKMITTSLTLGSGGVGGDFGPSLSIGATLGGAFGYLAQAFVDPAIDPGFFALVGMGAFYGSLAKVPLAALVIVCELTGTYDLLVPLMLSNVLGSLLLRRTSLYVQPTSRFDSPLHAREDTLDVLKRLRVEQVCSRDPVVHLEPTTRSDRIAALLETTDEAQVVFPVLDDRGKLVGIARRELLARAIADTELDRILIAADLCEAPRSALASDDLHTALELLLDADLRQLPIVDRDDRVVGLLDEHDIGHAYHDILTRLGRSSATGTPIAAPFDAVRPTHSPPEPELAAPPSVSGGPRERRG